MKHTKHTLNKFNISVSMGLQLARINDKVVNKLIISWCRFMKSINQYFFFVGFLS